MDKFDHWTSAYEGYEGAGVLSHGQGIFSSVLACWTGGMVYMLNICQGR